MTEVLGRHRRNLAGIVVVALAAAVAVAVLAAGRPDPGTAEWVAAKVEDPPDDCRSPEIAPLRNDALAPWRRWAEASAGIGCGAAGPVVQWARFRSAGDRDAALRAASGAPEFVCRSERDLVRMIGFPRASELATCAALGGKPV